MANHFFTCFICAILEKCLVVGFLWWVLVGGVVVCLWYYQWEIYINLPSYAHAWDTGGPPVYASNVAIFLCEWVTCTCYLHPLVQTSRTNLVVVPFWLYPLGYPCMYVCISPEVLLRLYPSWRKSQVNSYKFFFYLTFRYSVRIIEVSRPV